MEEDLFTELGTDKKVLYWIIGIFIGIFIIIMLITIYLDTVNGIDCEMEADMFNEEWNDTITNLYRDKNHKATYVIETKGGKKIYFQPIQGVYTDAEIGDRIIKSKKTVKGILIKNNEFQDTIQFSRIFSPTCDHVIKQIHPK